jgi:plasmid stabilization system protein ParE
MSTIYEVFLSEAARIDMRVIKAFLEERAGDELALLTLEYITHNIRNLVVFPYRFPIIDPVLNLRRMVIDKYRYSVFYEVFEETKVVRIHNVRHQAQNTTVITKGEMT